jgi:putative nucleotidyltransferase with HDIG domain
MHLNAATAAVTALAVNGDHETLRRFVSDLDVDCLYSRNHSGNVADHVVAIHEELGTPKVDIARRYLGALLHDIGKTAIPRKILGKPTTLTSREFDVIRAHPAMGADVVAALDALSDLADEIRHHHERIDGRGYPDGLSGATIPLSARIIAVADTFDAMTTDRVYRPARSRAEAIEELMRCSGTQLDREVVEAFLVVLDRRTRSTLGIPN